MTDSMIERFGKAFVCYSCAKATDNECSGCGKHLCRSCFATHRCKSRKPEKKETS